MWYNYEPRRHMMPLSENMYMVMFKTFSSGPSQQSDTVADDSNVQKTEKGDRSAGEDHYTCYSWLY